MRVTLTVEVEVDRISGKFASKEEIKEALADEIERADPGQVSGVGADGDSEYEITSWTVNW